MTDQTPTPHEQDQPDQPDEQNQPTHPVEATQRQLVLTFVGLIAGPLLALVSAVLGFVLILRDHTIAGVIFLLVPTQAFLFLGLWAYNARKKSTPPTR